MSDQTVKHDNSLPGFLLILLPAAFVAVFLSIAWPYIIGAVVFLTGNSVWQSYQWAKISQQVNPYFSQMVLEQQGEIAPLALSTRANISAPMADRYLQGKAAEIGGVSYRLETGGTVYSFLTVNSLSNTFVGLSSNESISQKLAELDYVVVEAETAPISKTIAEFRPVLEQPAPTQTVPAVVESVTPVETVVAEVISVAPAVIESVPPVETIVAEVISAAPAVVESLPVAVAKVEPTSSAMAVEPSKATSTIEETGGSAFAQALRGIFTTEHDAVVEEVIELEPTATVAETINQADLAKRLDVHPSTLYKRRSDVSFGDWTRNRDPEGVAWGYQRDTKEFYRLA
jgi:hypothetical protein